MNKKLYKKFSKLSDKELREFSKSLQKEKKNLSKQYKILNKKVTELFEIEFVVKSVQSFRHETKLGGTN